MIKATSKNAKGEPVYIFGLSHVNLERLKAGQPIYFDLKVLGGEGDVLICAGETEAKLEKEIKNMVIKDAR